MTKLNNCCVTSGQFVQTNENEPHVCCIRIERDASVSAQQNATRASLKMRLANNFCIFGGLGSRAMMTLVFAKQEGVLGKQRSSHLHLFAAIEHRKPCCTILEYSEDWTPEEIAEQKQGALR